MDVEAVCVCGVRQGSRASLLPMAVPTSPTSLWKQVPGPDSWSRGLLYHGVMDDIRVGLLLGSLDCPVCWRFCFCAGAMLFSLRSL